ncbi:MAG: DNA replication/repair protein RecF, partial [Bdellovibrionales bacterium]|nr:DNA replication/repair protein RecF [Bdellovibrionales bacterium]
MYLSNVKLYNFRNLKDTQVFLNPGLNFLIGKNGQGKTNFVEAIAFLASTKSFRTSKRSELIAFESEETSVFGSVSNIDQQVDIGIALSKGKLKAFIFGEQVQSVDKYLSKLLAVIFSPTDISLVKGAPAERRSFLDQHVLNLGLLTLSTLVGFQRALTGRARILKSDARHEATELGVHLDSW